MRTSVITIVAGRGEHLRMQRRGLARARLHRHVVVVMGPDAAVADALAATPLSTITTQVDVPGAGLPLAAARNAGAELALADGAELLVFLDVDCIPVRELVPRYVRAARLVGEPAVLAGPVAYLPPPSPPGYQLSTLAELAKAHPVRPVPPDGAVVAEPLMELFWSVSFAMTASSWLAVGGFHTGYAGYGAEDTDFAMLAAAAGAGLYWVGGATAYHQHHGPSGPTTANAPSIVRNAKLFHRRHGWWPMRGWLRQLAADGAVEFDQQTGVLELVAGHSACLRSG